MHYDPDAQLLIEWICYFVAVVGSVCSFSLLLIIIDRGQWTDHSRFVFYMTLSQFVYDILFFTQACNSFTCNNLSLVAVTGEVISFILSCQLQFIVFYLLKFKTVFSCSTYKYVLIAIVILPNILWLGLFLGGLYGGNIIVAQTGLAISIWLRVVCIVFNFVAYFWCRKIMKTLVKSSIYFKRNPSVVTDGEGAGATTSPQRIKSTGSAASANGGVDTSNREVVMLAVVNRLKWYPLVQACSRIFYTWYQSEPTWAVQLEYYSFSNKLRYAVLVLSLLTTLIAPVGFLIIYFKMQPKAWRQFKNRLHCRDKNYGLEKNSKDNDRTNDNQNNEADFNSIELNKVSNDYASYTPSSSTYEGSQLDYDRFSEVLVGDLQDEDLTKILMDDRNSITFNPINRLRPTTTIF
jgi:hypothetical protein